MGRSFKGGSGEVRSSFVYYYTHIGQLLDVKVDEEPNIQRSRWHGVPTLCEDGIHRGRRFCNLDLQ